MCAELNRTSMVCKCWRLETNNDAEDKSREDCEDGAREAEDGKKCVDPDK
jgi:hypothetical protein